MSEYRSLRSHIHLFRTSPPQIWLGRVIQFPSSQILTKSNLLTFLLAWRAVVRGQGLEVGMRCSNACFRGALMSRRCKIKPCRSSMKVPLKGGRTQHLRQRSGQAQPPIKMHNNSLSQVPVKIILEEQTHETRPLESKKVLCRATTSSAGAGAGAAVGWSTESAAD